MQIETDEPKDHVEHEPKIDLYLANVESFVIDEAEKLFPNEKIQKWLTELDLASCDSCVKVKEHKQEMRMIPGVPRDQKWIRVEPIKSFPMEKLEQMAKELKLEFRRDKDGHLIVHGTDEAVKGFIKKMTAPNGQPPK